MDECSVRGLEGFGWFVGRFGKCLGPSGFGGDGAIAIAIAGAVAVAIAIAGAVAGARAVGGAIAVVVAVAKAIAGAVAVAIAVANWIKVHKNQRNIRIIRP